MRVYMRSIVLGLAMLLVAGMLFAAGQPEATALQEVKTITFVADNLINDYDPSPRPHIT